MRIAASLASAPLQDLAQTVRLLEAAAVDLLHFDIEDGSFVPVMTLGTKLIGDLRPLTALPFDVHLMMVHPEWLLADLARMGANRISVHLEACPYPRRTLRMITDLGMSAGLAVNPATPVPDLAYLAPYLSFVLVLTTEPELPDSPFLPAVLEKVRLGVSAAHTQALDWVVDGGIRPENIDQVAKSGADTVVVGRALFSGASIAENMRLLKAGRT